MEFFVRRRKTLENDRLPQKSYRLPQRNDRLPRFAYHLLQGVVPGREKVI